MGKREFDAATPEWMDRKEEADDELQEDLENLRVLNSAFGAHQMVLDFVRDRLSETGEIRIVDLATGYADIPREIVRLARSENRRVRILAVDANPATLQLARDASREFSEIEFEQADIREFQIPRGVHLVLCNLALHHFSEGDAVRILANCAEAAPAWTFVSDLRRCGFLTFGIWLVTAFWLRAAMTRHDARLSAKRAFSHREFAELARLAGWENFSHKVFGGVRQAVWKSSRAG